jgi:hypothetical protein
MEELNKIDKKALFQAPQNITEVIENKVHAKIFKPQNNYGLILKLATVSFAVMFVAYLFIPNTTNDLDWQDVFTNEEEISEYLEEMDEQEFNQLYSTMQQ